MISIYTPLESRLSLSFLWASCDREGLELLTRTHLQVARVTANHVLNKKDDKPESLDKNPYTLYVDLTVPRKHWPISRESLHPQTTQMSQEGQDSRFHSPR